MQEVYRVQQRFVKLLDVPDIKIIEGFWYDALILLYVDRYRDNAQRYSWSVMFLCKITEYSNERRW